MYYEFTNLLILSSIAISLVSKGKTLESHLTVLERKCTILFKTSFARIFAFSDKKVSFPSLTVSWSVSALSTRE